MEHDESQSAAPVALAPAAARIRSRRRERWGAIARALLARVGALGLLFALLAELLAAIGAPQNMRLTASAFHAAAATVTGASTPARPTATPTPPLDLTQYVDPFVGTGLSGQSFGINAANGNTYPGATLPFGMVQFSPDTTGGGLHDGGYGYNDPQIRGFSLTHMSGAGCAIFGDIPFMPTVGGADPTSGATFSHQAESASPGAYSVRLGNGVNVELTATARTGFARVRFPAGATGALALEVGVNLHGALAAQAQVVSPTEVTGSVTGGQFCSYLQTSYTVYFDAQVSRPATSVSAHSVSGAGSGVTLSFAPSADQTTLLKIGVSYVSVANARANLLAENPGWDFDGVRAAASATWNTLLNRVQATGGALQDERTFYTALYHTLLAPTTFSDDNGQYLGFDDKVHTAVGYTQYANFSSWDIYRSEVPLLALVAPGQTSGMMQSLVNDGEQAGALPRWPVANSETGIMIGDSPAAILAEGVSFGAGDFESGAALRLAVAGATDPSLGAGDSRERPGLAAYLSLGYVPPDSGAWVPVSTSMEYYSDDFAIACLASELGQPAIANQFAARAAQWSRSYNAASGLPQPRAADGSFEPFDPTDSDIYIEGDAAQYQWMTPFDGAGLVKLLGGPTAAQQRLDTFFTQLNAGPSAPYAFMGNEPTFGAPWMYDFMGAPAKTQAVVRRIETQLYHDSPNGLAGNDDLGEMSSWYVWAALGMYPLEPGLGGFVLGSPLFPHVTLTLGAHVTQINAPAAAPGAPYVQALAIDGAPSSQLWLPVTTLEQARALTFTLSATPSATWGTAPGDAPPSLSSGGVALMQPSIAPVGGAPAGR